MATGAPNLTKHLLSALHLRRDGTPGHRGQEPHEVRKRRHVCAVLVLGVRDLVTLRLDLLALRSVLVWEAGVGNAQLVEVGVSGELMHGGALRLPAEPPE